MIKGLLNKLGGSQLATKSISVFIIKILGVLLFFGLTLFLTNTFKDITVGRYDFMRSVLLVLGGICMLGTNEAIIYYSGSLTAAKSFGSIKKIYLKMVLLIALVSLIFYGLINLIPSSIYNTFFEKEDAATLFYKVAITLFFFAITLFNIDAIRGLKKPELSEIYRNIIRHLVFFCVAFAIFFYNYQEYLVEAFMLSFIILAITTTIQIIMLFKKVKEQAINIESYKNIIIKSYPMALSAVAYFLMQTVDIIFLGKFEDFDTVAHYAVAVKLATVTTIALISVNVIIAPKIAELFSSSKMEELKRLIQQGIKMTLLLSIPGILILAIFNNFFLSLFGSGYTAATIALYVLLVGQAINIFCGSAPAYLNMTNKQTILQRTLFLGLVINICLNWLLIPYYGMEGAAFSTAFSMLVWNTILVVYIYRKDRVKMIISL